MRCFLVLLVLLAPLALCDLLRFGAAFTDHAVLSRAPAAAAVYGAIVKSRGRPTGVTITVTPDAHPESAYNVTAQHWEPLNSTYFRWKAVLPPTESGTGPHSITASCVGCATTTVATIRDAVFGIVWVCSGQSNMWLPMSFSFSRNRLQPCYDPLCCLLCSTLLRAVFHHAACYASCRAIYSDHTMIHCGKQCAERTMHCAQASSQTSDCTLRIKTCGMTTTHTLTLSSVLQQQSMTAVQPTTLVVAGFCHQSELTLMVSM